jgi:MFS transporter, DHA1 family, multidrug resistance protein
MGNLSAVGMERMGHLAGLAASVILALSTIGGSLIAAVIGVMFDGTALPLAVGVLVCAAAALAAARSLR